MTKHKNYQKWVPIVTIAAVVVAVLVGVAVALQPFEDVGTTCKPTGVEHTITVSDTAIEPLHPVTHRCDTLKIVNKSSDDHVIMFGLPNDDQPYDGIAEKKLTSGQSFTVNLNMVGEFNLHDHATSLVGSFTVE